MNAIIGKFVNIDTIIHKIDPRLKFLANILFIVLFFLADTFVILSVLLLCVMIFYVIATKSFRTLIRKFKLPVYIGLFLLIINVFTIKGSPENNIPITASDSGLDTFVFYRDYLIINDIYWAPFGNDNIFQITKFSLIRSASITLRIYGVILITTILTFTTKSVLLTKAINDLLKPLKLFKFPSEIITMIINIALRFIPTLLDEANRIMKAQSSRGVDFKNGHGKDKIKAFLTLIVPLFVSSFSKANDLSDAMVVRGYEPYSKRTQYRILEAKWYDIVATIILMLITTLVIVFQSSAINVPEWFANTFVKV
ncbi:energy-coupling factor transporter transmembrane component T family protein [Mycoplasma miroungirhinis]|uniref:Energy-coupling factor transporter transmembrane protein EcfT n=1 Tax=Mycoplasma miroungirhinis TaxID=754516 RepID=A0A6M4JDD2_9MOLU|nr:energy-coupling factor transporter transmembrane component T [Mycoplasma miroungirhinis]QJR44087.1 energy-coupling factor transporter transmembrane protein EcfT [Mycoplasma miroungirhinis]